MLTPINMFKQGLVRGELQIGLWMGLADAYAAELCAGSGFDWLSIDGEHAPHDLRSLLHSLQSIEPYPAQAVVRLPHGDPALIKQVLELGATTLIFPMVESAAQAQALVRATRYPPHGIRGMGSALGRSSRWTRYTDYLTRAQHEICVVVQAETAPALEQLEAICAVDGVDGVLIGPADLSASLGYLGQSAHPDVVSIINETISRIKRAGKAPGILCTDEALTRRYIAQGASFVAVGVDIALLVGATKALAAKFRAAPESPNASGAI